ILTALNGSGTYERLIARKKPLPTLTTHPVLIDSSSNSFAGVPGQYLEANSVKVIGLPRVDSAPASNGTSTSTPYGPLERESVNHPARTRDTGLLWFSSY